MPFSGSEYYTQGNVMGKDEIIKVEPCDHVDELTKAFASRVEEIKNGGKPDADWPRRSLAVHTVMSAVMESSVAGGIPINVVRT